MMNAPTELNASRARQGSHIGLLLSDSLIERVYTTVGLLSVRQLTIAHGFQLLRDVLEQNIT